MKEYETSDLGLIAALQSYGISYREIKPDEQNPERAIFIFEVTDLLNNARVGYQTNTLMVPAATYNQNLKTLKGVINAHIRRYKKN